MDKSREDIIEAFKEHVEETKIQGTKKEYVPQVDSSTLEKKVKELTKLVKGFVFDKK